MPRLFPLLLRFLLLACLLAAQGTRAQESEDDFFVFDEEEEEGPSVADPLEGFNRASFAVNDTLYRGLLKPVARGLRVLPVPVRTSLGNFFDNLRAPVSAASALLQGDVRNAGSELGRFLLNTTVGIVGLFDPATAAGLAQDEEDPGQTLARWGLGPGFYLVLPFIGPTSLRDFPGTIAGNALNPVYTNLDRGEIIGINVAAGEVALSLDQDTYEALYDGALDPYLFFRSAWAQNRAGRIAR